MIRTRQTVRIERHELPVGVVALTFADPERGDARDLPLVFILHGLNSRKERHLDLCLRSADAGFLACALDARYHGERWTVDVSPFLNGDKTSVEFLRAFGAVVAGTVADVRSMAEEMGHSRYGVIGHSMGGFIALQVALADPRVRCVVNISGSLDLSYATALTDVYPEDIVAGLIATDPVTRADRFAPRPLLLIHGDRDDLVPISGARRLVKAAAPSYAETPDRLALHEVPGIGHEWTTGMAEDAVAWITRYHSEVVPTAKDVPHDA